MQDDSIVRIPLRARDGSVRAYVTVDSVDADWTNQWRWHLSGNGYAVRNSPYTTVPRNLIFLHRELLNLTCGDVMKGDHIDRDRLNCKRSNLRVATDAENAQNCPARKGSSSPYRGVHWYKRKCRVGKWAAELQVNGKKTHLGYFTDELEAARVASEARKQLMPYATDEAI